MYRWALPEDQRPLQRAVGRLAAGSADAALFTAGAQVDHILRVAAELGLREAVLDAGRGLLVASIGPTCSAALRRHGLPPDLEPEHPKMGHLVVATAQRFERRAHDGRPPGRLDRIVGTGD